MAAITDKFSKVSDGTGVYPSVASVTAPRETSGETLSCDDLSGWPKDSLAFFSTFRLKADGTIDTSSQTDWKGIVKDNTITQMTRLAGAEDSGHLVGDRVMQNGTIGYIDSLVEGLLKIHNPDGTLKNDVIQTSNIANGAITHDKIGKNAVTPDNVDWTNIPEKVGSANNYCLKFPNGVMIACIKASANGQDFINPTSGLYTVADENFERNFPTQNPYACAFIEDPNVTMSAYITDDRSNLFVSTRSKGSKTNPPEPYLIHIGQGNHTVEVTVQAIGRWK